LYRILEVMDLIRWVEIEHSSVGLWNPGVEVKSKNHRRSENHLEWKTTSGKDRVPGNHVERKNMEVSEEKTMFQRTRIELIRLSTQ